MFGAPTNYHSLVIGVPEDQARRDYDPAGLGDDRIGGRHLDGGLVGARSAQAQHPELMAGALRVLLRQQFNSHLVLARAEIPRQERRLAIAAPGLVKPSFPQHGRLVVHAHTRLAHWAANVPVHEQDGLARNLEFDDAPRLVGFPVLVPRLPGLAAPALVGQRFERIRLEERHVLELIAEKRLGHGLDLRQAVIGRQVREHPIEQPRDETGAVIVAAVVWMHDVRLDVTPLHPPFLDLRPERVAKADHRQVVVPPHFGHAIPGRCRRPGAS